MLLMWVAVSCMTYTYVISLRVNYTQVALAFKDVSGIFLQSLLSCGGDKEEHGGFAPVKIRCESDLATQIQLHCFIPSPTIILPPFLLRPPSNSSIEFPIQQFNSLQAVRFQFKIALCQLSVTADKDRNIIHAKKAIEEAAQKGAKLVVLPEIWNSPYSNDSFPMYAEDIDAGGSSSPSTAMLSEVSRALKITIVGGSIPERCGDRLYNTCCIYDTDGKLKAKHRKIHLFDIDIPGKITFMESKTLTAGETPTVVDTEVGRIGVGICYDMRFQELAMLYAARGCHLICYPGAFNMTTGPLHWELLQRARAVDNQLYVATCAPARDLSAGYTAWGHSTLVGPFGEVLATTEHEEATIISEIDYSLIELRRTNLPLEKQRRGDIYQLVDVQRSQS
ncbi:hypothetical protein V2J09_001775 [Rumex salicifolius]